MDASMVGDGENKGRPKSRSREAPASAAPLSELDSERDAMS